MQTSFVERLETLYREVDAYVAGKTSLESRLSGVSPQSAHVCGSCYACCTAQGASFHHVQEVEHGYLRHTLGEAAGRAFRDFAERRLSVEGGFLHPVCPFYDTEVHGCGIYARRPYACRTFGHYRLQHTHFPETCIYTDVAHEVPHGEYFRALPLAQALRDLNRNYQAQLAVPTLASPGHLPDPALIAQARASMDPNNPLDQAVLAHLEHRLQDARTLFSEAVARSPKDGYAHFYHGQLLDELKEPQAAVASYRLAVGCEPENPRFWLHLAFALLDCNLEAEADQALARVLQYNPLEAMAHGFRGLIALQAGRLEAALPHMQQAHRLAPDNPFFALRLGQVLVGLGQGGTLAQVLEVALAAPQTRSRALQLLGPGGETDPARTE